MYETTPRRKYNCTPAACHQLIGHSSEILITLTFSLADPILSCVTIECRSLLHDRDRILSPTSQLSPLPRAVFSPLRRQPMHATTGPTPNQPRPPLPRILLLFHRHVSCAPASVGRKSSIHPFVGQTVFACLLRVMFLPQGCTTLDLFRIPCVGSKRQHQPTLYESKIQTAPVITRCSSSDWIPLIACNSTTSTQAHGHTFASPPPALIRVCSESDGPASYVLCSLTLCPPYFHRRCPGLAYTRIAHTGMPPCSRASPGMEPSLHHETTDVPIIRVRKFMHESAPDCCCCLVTAIP